LSGTTTQYGPFQQTSSSINNPSFSNEGFSLSSLGTINSGNSSTTPTFAGQGFVTDNINTQAYLSSNGANAPSSAGGQSSGWQNYDFALPSGVTDFNYGSQSSYASPSNYYGGIGTGSNFSTQGPNVVEGLGTGTIDTSFNAINQGPALGADFSFGGGGFGGFSFDEPILLDINGTGLHITQLDQSNMYYDMAGDGTFDKTSQYRADGTIEIISGSDTLGSTFSAAFDGLGKIASYAFSGSNGQKVYLNGDAIGGVLGSSIGKAIGGKNFARKVVATTLIGSLGQTLDGLLNIQGNAGKSLIAQVGNGKISLDDNLELAA
jgi:hypothetical protein